MQIKLLLLTAAATTAMLAQTDNRNATQDGPEFTADGRLMKPKDYRRWVFLGSGLGMTYGPAAQADQGNPMFDNVFVNPASYRAFLATGRWPDKTMFILEIRRAASKGSINNGGHYQTSVAAVEAAVKDERRFPEKWAYFGFAASGKDATASAHPPSSACNSCHRQNGAVENTFVQFYPALLEVATQKGTLNASYTKKASEAPGAAK